MKITVAIDNNVPLSASLPLTAEHGVSFLIEIAGKRVLYDVGQTGAVLSNLTILGVPATSLDAIVLSHGHYDHTGGLLTVLRATRPDVEVHIHPHAFADRHSQAEGAMRPIGIPFAEDYIKSIGGVWRESATPTEIVPGLWYSGTIPRVTDYETGDAKLVRDGAPDPIEDDTVLYVKGSRGLVTIGGCAHSGLVNAVRHGFAVTGLDRLQGWVGGTHLGPASPDQQERTIAQLVAWEPEFVAANHCTGFAMMSRLQQVFGRRFVPAFTGVELAID
jgi:7,8-dihydropterin-6-yl-methyl-4-(beta-D-ribofuranosyl)aminobenzene 5'-phosphate synthase